VSRLPIAMAMFVALAAGLLWLQGRFDGSDAKKGIALAMRHAPAPGSPSLFEALTALGEGDPRCDGEMVSRLFGDVRVSCVTPKRPDVVYAFRVLIDGKRPPKAESAAARGLLEGLGAAPAPLPAAAGR
jgi:hypothetical protein